MNVLLDSAGKLAVDADEAERFLIDDVINGHADVAAISDWLERFLAPVSGP